jgi:hypothetical protein
MLQVKDVKVVYLYTLRPTALAMGVSASARNSWWDFHIHHGSQEEVDPAQLCGIDNPNRKGTPS